jgi:hypothetical protein
LDRKERLINAGFAWLGAWAIFLLFWFSESGLDGFIEYFSSIIFWYSLYILYGIPSALVGVMLKNRWIAFIVGASVSLTVGYIMVSNLGIGQ